MRDAGKQAGSGRAVGILLGVGAVAVGVLGTIWVLRELRPGAESAGAKDSVSTAPAGAPSSGEELRSVQVVLDSARSYLKNMQPGNAEAILSAAVTKWPTDQSLRFLFGEALLTQSKKAEAYEQYAKGIGLGAEHPEYRHAAGTLAADLGKLDDAEAHFMVAQRLEPTNAKYPLFLGQVQRKMGKTDAARASLVTAAKIDPDLAIAWGSLAGIALDEGRPSVALGYIEKARRIEPARIEWRLIEAKALRRDAKPKQAAELLYALPENERAADANVLAELALCLGLMEQPGEAAKMYVDAARLRPEDAELNYQAAVWLDKDGQRERGKAYLSEAARLGHDGAKKLAAAWGD